MASPISKRLLEGVPFLVGEALDRHVAIAGKGPRTFQRLIWRDHREGTGFVWVLGDGHPPSVRPPAVDAAALAGESPRTNEGRCRYR
jgi:hypothetical protein